MKKISNSLFIVSLALLLNACGGGGSGGTTEGGGSGGNTVTKLSIIACDGTGAGVDDCAEGSSHHTCIQQGDTVVSENNNTLLEVIDNSDGSKKICVSNPSVGVAHILR